MNTDTSTPAALPATITLSKSNIRDFIEARGVNVPVLVAGQSLIDFIIRTAQDAAFNITKVPYKLKSDCQRAGQYAAKQALLGWVNEQFPPPGDVPKPLPRYTVDNGMIVACEAAEKAIRPWVWGNAHHTNPNRQAAGVAAQKAKIPQELSDAITDGQKALSAMEAAGDALPPSKPIQAPPVPASTLKSTLETVGALVVGKEPPDHHQEKTKAAVALANSEFEQVVTTAKPMKEADMTIPAKKWEKDEVPFSSAGIATADVAADVPYIQTLEAFLTEHGLRTMEAEGAETPWMCLIGGLADSAIASKAGMKAALEQGMVVTGKTELSACFNYAARNRIPFPEGLI